MKSKDEFFDTFKLWFLHTEEASREKLGCLQTNGGREFISTALKYFCKEKGIITGYTTPYMHKGNGIAEWYWRTLATMQDLILIDIGRPVNFWAEAMDTTNYFHNYLPTKRDGPTIIPEEA